MFSGTLGSNAYVSIYVSNRAKGLVSTEEPAVSWIKLPCV
jgi:hypothetical protein